MIKIALSNNIYGKKSIRKKMKMIWDLFCRQIAMTSLPLPMIFLSANTKAEVDFNVSNKDGPYNLVIPPLTVSMIVENFQKDVLPTDLKMQILGILFQELSRRVYQMEYLAKDLPETEYKRVKQKALEIIFTSTNAEVALMAEDEGPPLKVFRLPESSKVVFIFMYPRHKDILEARGFFTHLIRQGWMFC